MILTCENDYYLAVKSFCKMLHLRCLIVFWICQNYTRFWICLNNSWTWLNMPKYVWICLNLPECLLLYFPIVILCLLEHVVIYFSVYTKLEFIVENSTKLYVILKVIGLWGSFLEETKFDFFYSSWK